MQLSWLLLLLLFGASGGGATSKLPIVHPSHSLHFRLSPLWLSLEEIQTGGRVRRLAPRDDFHQPKQVRIN